MTSVYFPSQVAVIFRRVVHLISGLSVSTQYLSHKRNLAQRQLSEFSVDDTNSAGHSMLNQALLDNTRVNLRKPIFGTEAGRTLLASASGFSWSWRWPTLVLSSGSAESKGPMHESNSQNSSPLPDPSNSNTPTPKPPDLNKKDDTSKDIIHKLMQNSALYDPLRKPRFPIVLCHGLYGFDVIGPSTFPSLQMHYWSTVLSILRDKLGAEVIVVSVPGTASISARSEIMHRQVKIKAHGRGVNFLAHSMGGLDCRHLISHIKPKEYVPLSLTTVCTPHRGSPFMDWCANNIGIGKIREREELLSRSKNEEDIEAKEAAPSMPDEVSSSKVPNPPSAFPLSLAALPSSFTTLLLSIVDSPAYNNLTSTYLQTIFNPNTPDDPSVKYFSVAGRMPSVNIWHPFWLPKMVLDGVEERQRGELKKKADASNLNPGETPLWAREDLWGNDGLVTVQSAKWGEFLGIIDGADHWEMRGARGLMVGVESLPLIGGAETGDGWGLKDWARFVTAWKKEEKRKQDEVDGKSAVPKPTTKEERETQETLIKTSTEALSSVFDWLTEHIPGSGPEKAKEAGGEKQQHEYPEMKQHMDTVGNTTKRKKNELGNLQDIERFYLALSRKLYDEGL